MINIFLISVFIILFKIERLPVVNENGELIGLVFEQKILRKLLDYLNM